jgi:hypothetical protein
MSDNVSIDQQQLNSALENKLRQDGNAKDLLCKCWPCAKQILQLLLTLPTLPKQVADVIKTIIATGDNASNIFCK